jgi:hypothetical protein
MSAVFVIVIVAASVALPLASSRLWIQAKSGKAPFAIYPAIILLSLLLYATRVWVVPGGPFISVHAEVLPVLGCLTLMIVAVRTFRQYSRIRRIGVFLMAVAAAGLGGFVIANIISFWRDYYLRGAIVGW